MPSETKVASTRRKAAQPDVSIGVVLAKREFETWFLAAIESLRGRRGLPDDLQPIPDVENVQDAKGRLTDLMAGSGVYSSVPDQPALATTFDMDLARQRSDSFDKCWREIERLLAEAASYHGESP